MPVGARPWSTYWVQQTSRMSPLMLASSRRPSNMKVVTVLSVVRRSALPPVSA